jgi:hypothetical protein
LEGEEVFGSIKRKADLPPWSKVNSLWHDQMNFFRLKVADATTPINHQLTINVKKATMLILLSPTMVWRSFNAFVGTTFG